VDLKNQNLTDHMNEAELIFTGNNFLPPASDEKKIKI
jgi:hypothetical protein